MHQPDVLCKRSLCLLDHIQFGSSVTKFRKFGGNGSLTDKIYTSSHNQNYIHNTVLWLPNQLPSNKSICFKGKYGKKKTWQKLALPTSFWMFTISVDPESRWFWIASSSDMVNIIPVPVISYLKNSSLIFSYIVHPYDNFFPTSYPVNENEFGHTVRLYVCQLPVNV